MSVKIDTFGDSSKHEYKFANELKEVFKKGLNNASAGVIHIVSSAQLIGQNPRDVDIIVYGYLNNSSFNLVTNTVQSKGTYELRSVWLNNFCFTIEVKEHDHEKVLMKGNSLIVKYSGNKFHDATCQSEDQKYSLKNYFKALNPQIDFWINNFIWMKNLDGKTIKDLTLSAKHNILPSTFSLQYLIELLCQQNPPLETRGSSNCNITSFKRLPSHDVDTTFRLLQTYLTASRKATGELTRRNVERIVSRKIALPNDLRNEIGKKLIIISGRAGTGKTVRLLRMGCELASEKDSRCLFLTYNNTLVADLRRLLYLADVPNDFDDGCITVLGIHDFVKKLSIALGILEDGKYNPEMHLNLCSDISEYISCNVINQSDLIDVMNERHELACWDYIFVDEAQDFSPIERSLLLKLFGYNKIIVADGLDQFVRGVKRTDWAKNVFVSKMKEDRSLRQKKNIATFVNGYAVSRDLKWNLKIVPDMLGGKVVISKTLLPFDLFQVEREKTYRKGNKAFDILFLTPPSYISKTPEGNFFKLMKEFNSNGFYVWDGTKEINRLNGNIPVNKHRLIQYDSCRGLEGWCVICLGFDQLISYKQNTFANIYNEGELDKTNPMMMMNEEEYKNHFVNLWSLIPLTRAIDTLIITFDNHKNINKLFSKDCLSSDYVEVIE
jgi:hypothetical protein